MSTMSTIDRLPPLEPEAIRPGAAVRLLPAGRFRASDGRPQGVGGWWLDASIAARLVASRARTGADYVIDYEHQTLNAEKNGQPAPAAGWFKALEWREADGLYMRDITWTDKARQMIAAREYRHLSPVFRFDPATGAVVEILGAALTNSPALAGLVDLAAASVQPAAAPDDGRGGMSGNEREKFQHVFGYDPVTMESVAVLKELEDAAERARCLALLGEKDRDLVLRIMQGTR